LVLRMEDKLSRGAEVDGEVEVEVVDSKPTV
jgi:hypothetical protein